MNYYNSCTNRSVFCRVQVILLISSNSRELFLRNIKSPVQQLERKSLSFNHDQKT